MAAMIFKAPPQFGAHELGQATQTGLRHRPLRRHDDMGGAVFV